MENEVEVQGTQPIPEGETPKVNAEVAMTPAEIADLKHKAEISSQNYERAKKAEARLKELESNNVLLEEEGKDDEETGGIKKELSELKTWKARSEVIEAYPHLKEAWNDFEAFHATEENKGMNLKTAAKAFLVEKGLLEPTRKGLEKPTGGTKTPPSSTMSNDEVKNLRETNYRKYVDMLKKGQIKV